jgi:hypothetical protein
LKRRLETALAGLLAGPVTQRHDTTEVRIAAGAVTDVMRTLHDDPTLRFRLLADICGVDTGTTMQVVYHVWSDATPDWLRVIVVDLPRNDPRLPSITFLWKGAEWVSARPTICSASSSRATATCAASTCRPTGELPARCRIPAARRRLALAAMGIRHGAGGDPGRAAVRRARTD